MCSIWHVCGEPFQRWHGFQLGGEVMSRAIIQKQTGVMTTLVPLGKHYMVWLNCESAGSGQSITVSPQMCQENKGGKSTVNVVYGVTAVSTLLRSCRQHVQHSAVFFYFSSFIYTCLYPSFYSIVDLLTKLVACCVCVKTWGRGSLMKSKSRGTGLLYFNLPYNKHKENTHTLNLPEAGPCPILFSNRE